MNINNKMFRLVSVFALSFFVTALQTGCDNEDIVCECPDGGGNSGDNGSGEGPEDGNMVYMTFTAGSELNDPKSRTQIGKGDSVYWQKGDEMSVFNKESESSVIFRTEDDNTTNATFGGDIKPSENGKYLALYPYNQGAVVENVQGSGTYLLKSFVNSAQVVPSTGGYDPKACHSFAVLSVNEKGDYYGKFRLLGGMLGLQFDIQLKESPLDRIKISLQDQTSAGHPHLGGNYTLDISDPEAPKATFNYAESHEIIVTTDEKGFQSDTEYLISLPAISGENKVVLIVTFVRKDGKIYTEYLGRKDGFTLERAHIKPVAKLPLTDDKFKEPPLLEIDSEQEFVEWYNNTEVNQYAEVRLTKDLDLANSGVLKTRKYAGIFDGAGFRISNMTVSKSADNLSGFLGNVTSGEIKNLTLLNFTTSDDKVKESGTIAAYIQNGTKITNCKVIGANVKGATIGGLVGKADRSVISKCEVRDVYVSGTRYVGGLVGHFAVGNTISASYVHGILDAGWGISGGILGLSDSGNSVTSCYSVVEIEDYEVGQTGVIYGKSSYGGTTVTESYYAGKTTLSGAITTEVLKGKKDVMNSAISASGFEYVINEDPSTKDELPLVIVNKKAE